eukprot:CAMPEP_0202478634 /NCGR_PEP_ID=MMETSP1360-20130828/94559_1 /ASSEMBLY_ACC=CAM_ASM_000848 /TAXON_ID=515479 /ORGANISM="Licmophora paradoxa, Strain CCMP2313" /LENGTH=400 /DNA_ID=CAMNT_0049105919 /DNA_START=2029 /DNA_END=3231 /DNA_ORIENTATION=-
MIQKTWRCYCVHVDYFGILLGVIMFQRSFRDYQKRQKSRQNHAAVVIQRHARGFTARAFQKLEQFAATIIQCTVRGSFGRKESEWRKYKILQIQSVFRMALERRRFLVGKAEVLFIHAMARRIQRMFRRFQQIMVLNGLALVMQKAVRGMIARRRLFRLAIGVKKLQGVVRGQAIRKTRSKKLILAARRVIRASERAHRNPNLRLGVLTRKALRELQVSKRLSEIMQAAKILECSTRLSRNCCIAFAEAHAPTILYNLIGSCNRSLPHVEILHFVLLTLRNVVLHADLLYSVATAESVNIFLDLVCMFRGKDEVFCEAIPLLSMVVRRDVDLQANFLSLDSYKRLSFVAKKVSQSQQIASTRVKGIDKRSRSVRDLRSLLRFLEKHTDVKGGHTSASSQI